MSKKNQDKKIFEDTPIESADVHRDVSESDQPEPTNDLIPAEAPPAENISPTDEVSAQAGSADVESEENSSGGEASSDDLLEDVRRSLIEAESEKAGKDSKWWQRLGRRGKKAEPQEPVTPVEIDLPPVSNEPLEISGSIAAPEDEIEELDDLIDLLKADTEGSAAPATVTPEVQAPPEPEPEIDFDELKKQVFRPRTEGEAAEPVTDVRSIALEGGEEVLVEVEAKAADPMQERISAFENALKPYRSYLYIALAILGAGMAVVASLLIYNALQRARPAPVQEVSNLPYPTGVSLPGGWSFNLGKGTLQNGEWNPQGPEWLQGTEVCRWVALPWSRQLEAVIRTLNPKDPISLVMSNNDKLTYDVYSVQQLTPQELQKVDSNSPCLLLILVQPDVETRWVLTALP